MATVFSALGGWAHASLLISPSIGATVTIVAFLSSVGSHDKDLIPGPWSIAIGFALSGVFLAVILGIYKGWYQLAGQVYPAESSELKARLERASWLCSKPAEEIPKSQASRIPDIKNSIVGITNDLNQPGPQWLGAYGYLDAWRKLHRVEEALYSFAPITWVIAGAKDDLLRFQDSQIPQTDKYQKRIEEDLKDVGSLDKDPQKGLMMREDLSAVRHAINTHREDQWEKLYRTRNLILLGGGLAAGAGFAATIFMTAQNLQKSIVADVTSLVLVGVLVSLIHQITIGVEATDIEDFGQAKARLLVATLVSGLFAPIGAIILGIGFASALPTTVKFESWQQWLNWSHTPGNIIAGAIAAFAPSQVFALMQGQMDKTKAGLTATTSTGSAGQKATS